MENGARGQAGQHAANLVARAKEPVIGSAPVPSPPTVAKIVSEITLWMKIATQKIVQASALFSALFHAKWR